MSLMEYYSDIKKNEIVPFATIWMDLKIVIMSEISQTEEKHLTFLICEIYKKMIQMKLFAKQK